MSTRIAVNMPIDDDLWRAVRVRAAELDTAPSRLVAVFIAYGLAQHVERDAEGRLTIGLPGSRIQFSATRRGKPHDEH